MSAATRNRVNGALNLVLLGLIVWPFLLFMLTLNASHYGIEVEPPQLTRWLVVGYGARLTASIVSLVRCNLTPVEYLDATSVRMLRQTAIAAIAFTPADLIVGFVFNMGRPF